MSITRGSLLSVITVILSFSSLACGQTATNGSPISSDDVVAESTSQTVIGTEPAGTEPAGTGQTYAGTSAEQDQKKSRSTPIELAQRRFDDGCINLLAYDSEDTYINVRDQPNGNIVRSLPNFALIQSVNGPPIDVSEGWNEVVISMTQSRGYIHSNLISHTTYEVLDPNDTSANLRSSPDGEVITALPNGSVVRFLGRKDSWTQIETQTGETGYIASTLLAHPSCF